MIPFMVLNDRGRNIQLDISDLRRNVTYMVVSNHQSQWDSFVELAVLNNAIARRLLPYRAMTHNAVLGGGLKTGYLLGMGCFPSKPHETLPSGVDFSTELIKTGQTVFIYPEGRRTLPGETPPRRGVSVLADLPNVALIPARIQWQRPNKWQKTFKVAFGKPFDGHGMTPEEIMEKVYSLELP